MTPITRTERTCRSGATISPLVVVATDKKMGGRRVWRLQEPLVLDLGFKGGHFRITVPAGFETDYSSIPRFAWWLYPHDECAEAGVIHDWLYRETEVGRFFCDAVMRLVMQLTDKRWGMRVLQFWGVRLGGWLARKKR